ncbi:MAG: hypothetical protein EOO82_03270 [Oxalobacteraceae bacterium]|nr:MAG: hypothetical protein EOO82_03270 [Oxalobacteraceae bacterium]
MARFTGCVRPRIELYQDNRCTHISSDLRAFILQAPVDFWCEEVLGFAGRTEGNNAVRFI